MKILIYEDHKYKSLYPLSMLRSVFDIKTGINTIFERIKILAGKKFEISILCRKSLTELVKEFHKCKVNDFSNDDYLLLNGRVIFTNELFSFILKEKSKNTVISYNNEIIAAFISKNIFKEFLLKINSSGEKIVEESMFKDLSLKTCVLKNNLNVSVINYSWDIIRHLLKSSLTDDFEIFLKSDKTYSSAKKSESIINHKNVFTKERINCHPNVVLDASSGKIIVSENVNIEPFTFIKGPVFLGKNVTVKAGTKIYGPCIIGEYSKIAGEIGESVLHSYVNKQHDGFIGHSYICPFVNLGADTVTSDLKNNYSEIRIKHSGEELNTGMRFLGSIIGDHSKTSINTMLNTGSVIGIFANLFGGGFHEKFIQSFSWDESGKVSQKYEIEKAVETAKIVMKRRGIKMSEAYEKLVKYYSSLQFRI